jgi:hypothetical protein
MHHIILLHVASLAVPYSSTYLINGTIFGKKVIEYNMCFDFVWNISEKH